MTKFKIRDYMPEYKGMKDVVKLADQHKRLFYCKFYNQDRDMWETFVNGLLVNETIYKEGCGLATILKDDKWAVIDRNRNYIVPPGA